MVKFGEVVGKNISSTAETIARDMDYYFCFKNEVCINIPVVNKVNPLC